MCIPYLYNVVMEGGSCAAARINQMLCYDSEDEDHQLVVLCGRKGQGREKW